MGFTPIYDGFRTSSITLIYDKNLRTSREGIRDAQYTTFSNFVIDVILWWNFDDPWRKLTVIDHEIFRCGFEQECHAKFLFSLCRRIGTTDVDRVFLHFPLQTGNAVQKQSCVPRKTRQLLYSEILKCLDEIWRTWQKFWREFEDIGVLTGVLTNVWPQVGVDLIKRVTRDCLLRFWSDDPGWPCFDKCQQCLTQLIQSLARMRLIKNLGRHSLAPLKRISSWDSKVKDEVGGCSWIELLPIKLSWSSFTW
jgi:hypothetical protein